jgi:hypothetical protein
MAGFVNRKSTYVDPAIFNHHDYESTGSVTITDSYILANSKGRKELDAGHFIARFGNEFRFLPRAVLTTASATNATTFTVAPKLSQLFNAGDVLFPTRPTAIVTLSGTLVAADTVTVTLNGYQKVFTATGSNIATFIDQIVVAINTDPVLDRWVEAIAVSGGVQIFGEDTDRLLSISVADSSSNLTTAISGSATALQFPNTAVGTVSSVNTTTGVITLTGNAGVALPVGARVTVRVDEILGLNHTSWDFTDMQDQDVAYYASAGCVRTSRLPYFDKEIGLRLNGLVFQSRF